MNTPMAAAHGQRGHDADHHRGQHRAVARGEEPRQQREQGPEGEGGEGGQGGLHRGAEVLRVDAQLLAGVGLEGQRRGPRIILAARSMGQRRSSPRLS